VVISCTTRFNTQIYQFMSTKCIYIFCIDLRTNRNNTLNNINSMTFITEIMFSAWYELNS